MWNINSKGKAERVGITVFDYSQDTIIDFIPIDYTISITDFVTDSESRFAYISSVIYEKNGRNRVRTAYDSLLVIDLDSKQIVAREPLYDEPDDGKEGHVKEIVFDEVYQITVYCFSIL